MTMTDVVADTVVAIDLPLPLDVTSSLMRAIGDMYPGAQVRSDGDRHKLTIMIPDSDRRRDDVDGEPTTTPAPTPADVDAFLASIDDGTFGVSGTEWLARVLVHLASGALDRPDADNYVELTLADSDLAYAVALCRSTSQTPHALRMAAEERAERLAQRLRELGEDPDGI